MKFLIIQENGRHPISRHLRECNSLQRALLFHGEDCDVWGIGHDNFNKKPDFSSYDIIINLENYDTGWVPDLSTITKPIKLIWAIDSHCRGKDYYTAILKTGKYTKILEATNVFLDENRIWFPNCYDADFIVPMDIEKTTYVGFCGNLVNRGNLLYALQTYIPDFKIDINVRGINMIQTINSYQIHFNKNMSVDINYRNFETLGCGTLLFTDKNKQYEELGFKEEEHFITYGSFEEAISKLESLRNNIVLINSIAKKGHEFGKTKHTFKNRAKTLIEIIKSL